jgi:VWFA-related protein
MKKALAILLTCAGAAVVHGQSKPQTPTFRTTVDLVQVDVVVVDKEGNAVRGLRQSDFAVYDRGKRQTIAAFEEVARHHETEAPAPLRSIRRDVSMNQGAQADRLVVMVIDDLHIYKERTDRAKTIARRVVADLGAQSSMAVLFTSGDHSTQVTQDPAAVAAAIETLKGRQSWRRPHHGSDQMHGARIDPEDSIDTTLSKIQNTQDATVQDFVDNMRQYRTLQDASRLLGGGDLRRKAFVLVSEGIGKDLSGIFGAMRPQGDAPTGGLEYASGNLAGLTELPPGSYHADALIQMMEAMRRANVTTYAIDPRGKVESKDLARECFPAPHPGTDPCSEGMTDWVSPVRQAQYGLEMIAEASGGFAVTNTDDFTGGLNKIVEDLDHYYLIGFYPADAKGRNYRLLDVKVTGHPDWKLRFRRGYMPSAGAAGAKPANPLTSLSAGILPHNDLPLRLTAIATPGAANLAHVVLALEVSAPRRDLQDRDGKVRDSLTYEVLVVDEKKARVRSVGGLEGRLVLSPTANAAVEAPDTVTYQVTHGVDLVPGHFEFRVSAISSKLAKGGSVYLAVDVPEFHAAPVTLGGLALGYSEGPRVPVAPTSGSRASATLPFPLTLDREFVRSDTLRVHVEGTSRSGATLAAAIDVVDAGTGKVVASPSPSFTSGDPVRIDATIELRGLTPGAYVLRATLSADAQKATRETGFLVK